MMGSSVEGSAVESLDRRTLTPTLSRREREWSGPLSLRERAGVRGRGCRQELDDLPEGLEGPEVLGLDDGGVGELLLQRREDLDALDRVDAEVGVEPHGRLGYIRGMYCFLLPDRQQRLLDGGRSGGCAALTGRARLRRSFPTRGSSDLDDLPEGLEGPEVLGLDDGRVGELLLERREDLDAFDRIDAEVGIQSHD